MAANHPVNERAAWAALPLDMITVPRRLRAVHDAAVANMVVAIQESGFTSTILVRPITGDEGARYELVAGAHRLAAMRRLGRPTIPATVRILTDDEALQIEIDENLVRRDLTPLERAETLEARFAVWSRRFPQLVTADDGAARPKRGRPSNSVKMTEFLGGAPATMGFAENTASELGLSKSTVERAWRTVTGLPAALRQQLRGTWVAKNEGALRQLAGVEDAALQARAAEFLLEGRTKSVADALAYAGGNAPIKAEPASVSALQAAFDKLWKAASATERADLIAGLAARKLPGDWALIPSDAPEFAAYQARVNPAAIDADDLLQGFDDE
jgi:ParB family chromosome partitioning protein